MDDIHVTDKYITRTCRYMYAKHSDILSSFCRTGQTSHYCTSLGSKWGRRPTSCCSNWLEVVLSIVEYVQWNAPQRTDWGDIVSPSLDTLQDRKMWKLELKYTLDRPRKHLTWSTQRSQQRWKRSVQLSLEYKFENSTNGLSNRYKNSFFDAV